MVVPLYVLVVVIGGCLLKCAVPGGPLYGESFRRGVVISYVAVVLVFDHPFPFHRGGLDHALVVKNDPVPLPGQLGGQCAGDCLSTVHLLRSVYAEGCAVVSVVYSSPRSTMSFRSVGVLLAWGGPERGLGM